MYIKSLKIKNFRNYDDLSVNLKRGINIIYGENGQGKTNLLESLYVLALTKSHRSYIDNNIIKKDKEYLKINGSLYIDNIKNKLEIIINKNNKKLFIDNNEIKKVSNYISLMNIIIFYPDDLDLIKGSPSIRRRYLNLEISQLYNNYYVLINEYNKILKIRNDYLKKNNNFDKNYFDVITDYLIDKSISIYILRNKFIERINENISDIFKNLTGIDNLKLDYVSIINSKNKSKEQIKMELIEQYKKIYEKEKKYKLTLIGPHRDDFNFFIEENNLKNYGSQGQHRMAVLALKLSEIEIFKKYKNNYPILLLDDVFSELDRKKKNNFLMYLNKDIQTIITTTDLNQINKNIRKNSHLIEIKNGKIKKITEVI